LERDDRVVIVKEVPAEVCDNCAEYDLDEEVAGAVSKLAEEAFLQGAQLRVVRYVA